jgi:MFS family permease
MEQIESQGNHPLAPRMCAIAFLSYNVVLGCLFGSFGVLVPAVEAKMGVNRDLSSVGLPCVLLGLALTAPIAGALANRFSIRLLMLTGALMNLAGYAILAISPSIILNLFVYALLLGPGQALAAIVMPSTLVTRWYNVNRGRALGVVHMPIVPGAMPLLVNAALRNFGLSATYWLLAAVIAVSLVPMLFAIDFPPGSARAGDKGVPHGEEANQGISVRGLLGSTRFWALSVAAASVICTSTVLSAHLVPMARGWGIDATRSAGLLGVAALTGMAGALSFGWLSDRLGGARTLALLCLDSAILWALMLFEPPVPVLLSIVALMGLHGAAIMPTLGMSLSQHFGRASFGRAFGIAYLVALPFNLLAVPAAAHVYVRTGSYSDALIGMIGFLIIAAVLAAMVPRPTSVPVTA